MLPQLTLDSSQGPQSLRALAQDRVVLYIYPRSGRPGRVIGAEWDAIPGARGCTPQSCGFRDHHAELAELQAEVFGFSTQTTAYQKEMSERLHLPFAVLSDAKFELCDALRLPTFEVEGTRLVKRITLIVRNGRIEHVFYPVFPPNESADEVLGWLRAHPLSGR